MRERTATTARQLAWLMRPGLHGLLLCLLTAAAYSGALLGGFVWDDHALVLHNDITSSLGNLPRFFTEDLWASADGGARSGYYRPLMLLTLALDRAIWGLEPAWFHLHSLLWHLSAVFLLHRLLLALLPAWPALLGAAVFALHPVQSEAVFWISARNDPMAAALGLAAILLLTPEPSTWRLWLAGAAALAAMLAKESAILLPLLLLALDLGTGGPRAFRRYVALLAPAALVMALRLSTGVGLAPGPSEEGQALLISRGPAVLATYGGLLAWPWPLSGGRDLESLQPGGVAMALGLTALVLGGLLLVVPRRRRALALAGLAWAILAFAPSVVALAHKGLLGERYLYFPMAGIALAVGAAVASMDRRLPALLALLLPAVLILQLRAPDWRDDVSLWGAACRDTPSSYTHLGLAHVLRRERENRLAAAHFMAALRGPWPRGEACVPAINSALAAGDLSLALEAAELGAAAGCRAPVFRGLRAAALAMASRWEEAVALAADAMDDPAGRARLVMAAWAVVQGDCAGYQEEMERWKGPVPLDEEVARILRHGGHGAHAALLLRGGGSCL